METNIEDIRTFALSLQGVTEDMLYERGFAPDTINRLIEESYLLVLHQLPKKTREEISRLSHPLP